MEIEAIAAIKRRVRLKAQQTLLAKSVHKNRKVDQTAGGQHIARLRLVGHNRNFDLAPKLLYGHGLGLVAGAQPIAMGENTVDLVRRYTGLLQCPGHGVCDRPKIRGKRAATPGTAAALARGHGIQPGKALPVAALQAGVAFQHNSRCRRRHYNPVARVIERLAGGIRQRVQSAQEEQIGQLHGLPGGNHGKICQIRGDGVFGQIER